MGANVHPLVNEHDEERVVSVPGFWAIYRGVLEAKGDAGSPRTASFRSVIEIMSPGRCPGATKSRIGGLLEIYCEEAELDSWAWGSTTLTRPQGAGAEPDEAYAFSEKEVTLRCDAHSAESFLVAMNHRIDDARSLSHAEDISDD